jgi:hypothetical protein
MKRVFPATCLILFFLGGTIHGQFEKRPNPPGGPLPSKQPSAPSPPRQPDNPPHPPRFPDSPPNNDPPPGFKNPQFPPSLPGPQFVTQKVCTRCKNVVPNNSKIGDTCPFCGAKWIYEAGTPGQSQSGPGISASKFNDNTDHSSYGFTALRWVIVGTGIVVSAIIVLCTVRFLKNNL